MARARNIKPGFFRNEELADLDPLTRILFAGLWTIADREGRLEDRPKRIKADVLPYDDGNVDDMLDALAARGFIARYEHSTARYIQICNFDKHQNPHKNEAHTVIPPEGADANWTPASVEPEEKGPEKPKTTGKSTNSHTNTVQAPESHSTNPADSLNLVTDSGFPEKEKTPKPPLDPKPGTSQAADAARLTPPADPPVDLAVTRTAKQQASDAAHARRVALFEAWCRGIGLDPDSDEANVGRDIAFRQLKPLIGQPSPTADEFEACTRYLAGQSWRDDLPKISTVINGYGGWVAKNRPAPESNRPAPADARRGLVAG